MAYYDALIAKWPSFSGTTAQKLALANAATTPATAVPALLTPSQIINAIVFADLAALTQLQITQLTLLLQGGQVDASPGTPIRLGIQALFTGKATSLSNLGALVAKYDTPPVVNWCAANGYPTKNGAGNLSLPDLSNAGLS